MARDAHPKEMLAFIGASNGVKAGLLMIDEIQLQAYDASVVSATVPLHLLPTVTTIVGTVHSHPGSDRRPSRNDLALFGRYGMVHGIIGSPYTRESITFYDGRGEPVSVLVTDD